MFKRFFAAFLALCLVLALVASFFSFRSVPASAQSANVLVNHQAHVHLVPHKVAIGPALTGTISFTVEGTGLSPNDTYILSVSGLMPPFCSGNDSNFTALKTNGSGEVVPKLVTAGGCHVGQAQVELLDAGTSEFWYAILTVVH